MNYFAHAYRFLEDPYFVAGSAVPDWLSAADRSARVRSKQAGQFAEHQDPCTASVARGMLQHFRDDARFHEARGFVEVAFLLTAAARDSLDGEAGLRPGFLGHLLAEVLLDWALIEQDPARLSEYYRLLGQVDACLVQEIVNRMTPRPTARLRGMIEGFRSARILWDYREDARLLRRLNQVTHRLGMAPLPDRFCEILPGARSLVASRAEELLKGVTIQPPGDVSCTLD